MVDSCIWDQELIPQQTVEPMAYKGEKADDKAYVSIDDIKQVGDDDDNDDDMATTTNKRHCSSSSTTLSTTTLARSQTLILPRQISNLTGRHILYA